MKKYLVLLLALVMVFGIHSGVFAQVDTNLSVDGFIVDINGEITYKNTIEITSTNDTVTAVESGKVFVASTGGGYAHIKWELPAANDGLTYTFIQQGTGTLIELDPNGSDQFLYSTATAGDRLIGPATAGASITIWASDDTVWFVQTNGTFTIQED